MLTKKKFFILIILLALALFIPSTLLKNGINNTEGSNESSEPIDTNIQETEFSSEYISESETEEEHQLVLHSSISNLSPGEVIPEEQLDFSHLDNFFVSTTIIEGGYIFNRINGKSYQPNDDIALSDLRYLKMLHYNYNGEIQVGEMIVNKQIEAACLDIFQRLFEAQYQICRMVLIDDYWTGDGEETDAVSIKNNNTSCFNYRNVPGSTNRSKHALGLALDINPYENPYIPNKNGIPDYSALDENEYYYATNRNEADAHVITHNDLAYKLFIEHGFSWGGNWNSLKDYQHFAITN